MRKINFRVVKKCLQVSAVLVGAMAIVRAIHSFWTFGYVILDNLLEAGLLAGIFMIGIGLLKFLVSNFRIFGMMLNRGDKLLDKSTYAEKGAADREFSQFKAYEYVLTGLGTVIIAGALQVVFFVIGVI